MKRITAFLKKSADDLLMFAGFLAILIGTYQLSPIAAWFVGGGECLVAAFLLAWSKRK